MQQIYLDNAATTAPSPAVLEAMQPYLSAVYGNPSSVHQTGQAAKMAVDNARAQMAETIGAATSEIVFTAGGTEADFLALLGVLRASEGRHVVTTAIEHHAVLHTCELLEEMGYEVSIVLPNRAGIVDADAVMAAVRPDTALVSVMWVNNETGAVQPIVELAARLQERGIPLHSDAVQALGPLPVDVNSVPVSLLSFSGHKIYGPKGVGALYLRRGTPFRPIIRGGSQERNRRAGTENVAAIVGFAKAAELLQSERDARNTHLAALRERFLAELNRSVSDWRLNSPEQAVKQICNVMFSGVLGESLLMLLDLAGIAASGGSACTAGSVQPSHVLQAMGLSDGDARSSVRFSFSSFNTLTEVDRAVAQIADAVSRLRSYDENRLGS